MQGQALTRKKSGNNRDWLAPAPWGGGRDRVRRYRAVDRVDMRVSTDMNDRTPTHEGFGHGCAMSRLQSLYDAFVESKRRAHSRMRYAGSLSAMLPWLIDDVEEIDELFGGDAFPYGIEANRPTLQALVAYMVEQHFIARPIPIEDLFVPLADAILT
jgi:hypothetical protein